MKTNACKLRRSNNNNNLVLLLLRNTINNLTPEQKQNVAYQICFQLKSADPY